MLLVINAETVALIEYYIGKTEVKSRNKSMWQASKNFTETT